MREETLSLVPEIDAAIDAGAFDDRGPTVGLSVHCTDAFKREAIAPEPLLNACRRFLRAAVDRSIEQNTLRKNPFFFSCRRAFYGGAALHSAKAQCDRLLRRHEAQEIEAIDRELQAERFEESPMGGRCKQVLRGKSPASEALQARCWALIEASHRFHRALVGHARGGTSVPQLPSLSSELRDIGAALQIPAEQTQLFTDEAALGVPVLVTMRDAELRFKNHTATLPEGCDNELIPKLKALDSGWSRDRLAPLIATCHLRLGAFILASAPEDRVPWQCNAEQKRVYRAYHRLGLEGLSEALDEQHARFTKYRRCE